MAVKHGDIAELLSVIEQHVPADRVRPLLRALQKTNAFLTNQSFRETIRRITVQYLADHRDDPPTSGPNKQSLAKFRSDGRER